MKRWTKLILIGILALPAVAWAGHSVAERAGFCPFCHDDCPLMARK